MINWLLDECKLDLETKGPYERTPFLSAAAGGRLKIAKLLKERGANINEESRSGDNALHLACLSGSVKMTRWLLDVCKLGIEIKGQSQITPFLIAALKGDLAIAKLLKERDAHIHAKDYWGNNALHAACLYSRSVEMVTWLLDVCKVGLETKGPYERTPFLCAAAVGDLEIAKRLKERGANIHAKDKDVNNALHWAKKNNRQEMISYLQSLGLE